jgi:hypothetical protein
VVAEQFRNGQKWLIIAESRDFPYDVKMAAVTCKQRLYLFEEGPQK